MLYTLNLLFIQQNYANILNWNETNCTIIFNNGVTQLEAFHKITMTTLDNKIFSQNHILKNFHFLKIHIIENEELSATRDKTAVVVPYVIWLAVVDSYPFQ